MNLLEAKQTMRSHGYILLKEGAYEDIRTQIANELPDFDYVVNSEGEDQYNAFKDAIETYLKESFSEAKDLLESAGYLVEHDYEWKPNDDNSNVQMRRVHASLNTKFGNRTGWGGFTFRRPNANRKYVWVLQALLSGPKTKQEVHKIIGLPDPTANATKNVYTSMWSEMRNAGLIDYKREGNDAKWFLTDRGYEFLEENNLINKPTDEDPYVA